MTCFDNYDFSRISNTEPLVNPMIRERRIEVYGGSRNESPMFGKKICSYHSSRLSKTVKILLLKIFKFKSWGLFGHFGGIC